MYNAYLNGISTYRLFVWAYDANEKLLNPINCAYVFATDIDDKPVISGNCLASVTKNQKYNCSLTSTNPDKQELSWKLGSINTCKFITIDGKS